jgi:hypothetical protein
MMIDITMLIYTVSLALQLPVCVTIHNQCSNVELVSPVYFGNGAICPKLSNQQINIGIAMRVCFEINATQDDFEGALLYRLQRYVKLDVQCGTDILTTETNKNDTKCVHILIVWKVKDSKHFLYAVLVEHIKGFTWSEDKLKRLYYENHNRLKGYDDTILDTWYMDDNMTLKTSLKVRGTKRNFELNVFISEEERDDYAMKPLYIDPKR